MKTIKLSDFTKCPGGRYQQYGPGSAQEFFHRFVDAELKLHGVSIVIDLSGTMGVCTSFLSELIYLITHNSKYDQKHLTHLVENMIMDPNDEYMYTVLIYITNWVYDKTNILGIW